MLYSSNKQTMTHIYVPIYIQNANICHIYSIQCIILFEWSEQKQQQKCSKGICSTLWVFARVHESIWHMAHGTALLLSLSSSILFWGLECTEKCQVPSDNNDSNNITLMMIIICVIYVPFAIINRWQCHCLESPR